MHVATRPYKWLCHAHKAQDIKLNELKLFAAEGQLNADWINGAGVWEKVAEMEYPWSDWRCSKWNFAGLKLGQNIWPNACKLFRHPSWANTGWSVLNKRPKDRQSNNGKKEGPSSHCLLVAYFLLFPVFSSRFQLGNLHLNGIMGVGALAL